jgi:HSP20 family protein
MTVRNNRNGNLDIWNDFDRMFDSFFNTKPMEGEVRTPVTNVSENENGFEMSVELPGFSTKELEVKVEENLLSIKAAHREAKKEKKREMVREERRSISFERSFVLPKDIDSSRIEADLKNGLLLLKLPRQEKAAPLNIKINS